LSKLPEYAEEQSQDAQFNLSRRSLLKCGSLAVISLASPFVVAADATSGQEAAPAASTPSDSSDAVIARLSSYMSEAGDRSLPEEVVEKSKEHILDTIAAMISGVDLPPAQVALKFARAYPGDKVATIVGSTLVCGAIEAAIANGMLAHSDETDDSHAPSHSHPGCAIVAAALAAGEQFGIDGSRFLRAVTLGYDVGPRVLLTLGGLPFQMQTHHSAHSIANTFGASAAAACAARLDAQQMRWVLDYAAQQASGIAAWQRDTQHVEKSLVFGGMPARNGVTSALLIHLGATGVNDVFSGPDNFLLAFAPQADPSRLIEKLGERYEVTRTSIKKWTVGSPIQAPLDALQQIMKEHSLDHNQIKSVVVRVARSEAKTVNNRDMPDISMQHMMAVMLLDKTVSFQAAHDKARMRDPEVLKERAKVQLVPDDELEKLYPKRETIVEVTLNDGSKLTQRIEAVRGTPDNPMTREELQTKARDLMEPFLGAAKSRDLIQAIFEIETRSDIRTLRPLLQRG
jgi:2-methylcitrate dehydratase PrpD